MKKTKPNPKPSQHPNQITYHLKFDERIILEVKEGSRELENKKKPKPNPNPNPSQHPNQITYHLKFDERIISNQIHIIFKLMKISFLEVRERSRELENEKNQTQTQTNTKPNQNQHPNQITYHSKFDERIIPGSERGE